MLFRSRKLISFMHGEYLFQLALAYAAFSVYYFWDSFYLHNFAKRERWTCDQYVVYLPDRLKCKQSLVSLSAPEIFLTYYCSNESKQTITALKDVIDRIEKKGAAMQSSTSSTRFAYRAPKEYVSERTN